MPLEGEGVLGLQCDGGWLDVFPCQVLGDGHGGVRELDFGPLRLENGRRPSWLRLLNLLPYQVGALCISDGRDICYELVGRTDAVGRSTSAGDLLLAMARMEGWNGLVVDLRRLRCVNAATRVQCKVLQVPLDLAPQCRLQVSRF
jgi:hypothetical protein